MSSSVKPLARAKVVNFSFTAARGVWVRPGQDGNARGLSAAPLRVGAPLAPPGEA